MRVEATAGLAFDTNLLGRPTGWERGRLARRQAGTPVFLA